LPIAETKVVVLDISATQLREDFNRAHGAVRLLLVVDPICPVCLRGLADVNDSLLATTRNPRVQTFVVYEPVIGGTAADIPVAAALLHNPDVHNYWDPSGNFGRQLSAALQLKHADKPVYAWDVWMIYDADAIWQAANSPQPALFMHQLPALRGQPGRPFLNSAVFAAKARELLTDQATGKRAN
jgi:hypothetical protein